MSLLLIQGRLAKMIKKTLYSSSGLVLGAILSIAIIILANAGLTSLRLDLTESKLFTLSEGTVNILQSLDEPISLDFYFSRKTLLGYPGLTNYGTRVRDLLEEYATKSGGKIQLTIIEPESFSEEEDQAVASGLQGAAINTAGDRAYFGLVGTNSTDDELNIPFFQDSRESALEYDITKLIYNLANPKKRVVGVISSLPLFGAALQGQPTKAWTIIGVMQEFFEIKDLGASPTELDEDVDVLMVIHPKNLKDETLFAIDQFMLAGGNALFFVDPLAETDRAQPDPQNPMVMPDMDSDLKVFLEGWGIEVLESKLAADITSAMRVQTRSARGPQETLYLPWLRLAESSFNREDFTTSELKVVHVGTSGIIEQKEESSVEMSTLIQTTKDSMKLERDLILFQQDPAIILDNFVSENKQQNLAVRLSGHVNSAYPEGDPAAAADGDAGIDSLKEGDINVILVADTDILSDIFWIRTQSFFGVDIPQPIANNGDFVVNTLENLSGNTDLISLRSRGEFSRPFEVVEAIRREAEDKFRDRERELQAKLTETEQRIQALQREGSESELILSKEQNAEIDKFQTEQLKVRKELRAVQHELQKNIESLGSKLKFINIGLMPLLIMIAAIATGLYRTRRRYH
jgi:gliding motility-associatede transport system auxiliary component